MPNKHIVICGLSFGDEGKGSFVNYLANKHNILATVKYNGGCHAAHTVTLPTGVHVFSQLGSGMSVCHGETYLTENTVVNLFSLVEEVKKFVHHTVTETVQDVLYKVHIHENCWVVTPYHRLLNRVRELSLGSNRRGSVGTGVSEVPTLRELGIGVQIKDIFSDEENFREKLYQLHIHVYEFLLRNNSLVAANCPPEKLADISREIERVLAVEHIQFVLDSYKELTETYEFVVSGNSTRLYIPSSIWEGSQGLLLDLFLGIRPNTTNLDTTTSYALKYLDQAPNVSVVGIAKAFFSRHGKGVFPTEDSSLKEYVKDKNQNCTYWNGEFRLGWFDAVLTRYAISVNKVEEVYLSCLDQLTGIPQLKICTGYLCPESVYIEHRELNELFFYSTRLRKGEGELPGVIVKITGIKKNFPELEEYLSLFTPIYTIYRGWKKDISCIDDIDKLPRACKDYLRALQYEIGRPITIVSVGPKKIHKIEDSLLCQYK